MKHVVRWSRVGIFFVVLLIMVAASTRPGNYYADAPGDFANCTACHSSFGLNSGDGSLTLSGAPAPGAVAPNTTYNLTLTLEDPGQVRGGFQMVAVDDLSLTLKQTSVGTFVDDGVVNTLTTANGDPGPGTEVNSSTGRITHHFPQNFVNDRAVWNFQWTSPAVVSGPIYFYYTGNAGNNATSTSGDYIYAANTLNAALPVEFVAFAATVGTDDAVLLHWITATELNNDYFAVERSLDGKEFTEIATVLGAGTTESAQEYRYVDVAAPAGREVYYRLRQVDFDGQFSYSETVTVRLDSAEGATLSAFPNPAPLGALVTVRGLDETPVQLFDLTGRVWTLPRGTNGRVDLPEALVPGMYLLRNGNETVRLVLQ